MSDRIGAMVTGKARHYLRTSTALFCLALCVVCSYLVFLENQAVQRANDFTDNATVHLIRVTGPAQAGAGDYLRFADVDRVEDAVTGLGLAQRPEVTTVYALGYGIPDQHGDPRFVYGLDGDGARLLGIAELRPRTLYGSAQAPGGDVVLEVPVVDVTGDGFSSSTTVDRTFRAEGGISGDNPLAVLGQGDPAALYTGADTFATLVADSFGTDWPTFRTRFDQDNPFGTQVISDVYVHVDSLDDVEAVADRIDEAGYATTYTLEAFDDLAGSLSRSALLGLAAVGAAFLGCLAYVLLSIQSYLRVSHKDMAILRHAGFSAARVGRMYGRRLLRIFAVIAVVAGAYQAVVTVVVLGADAPRYVAVNLLLTGLALAAVASYAVRVLVHRHSSLDVLTLLKHQREFE